MLEAMRHHRSILGLWSECQKHTENSLTEMEDPARSQSLKLIGAMVHKWGFRLILALAAEALLVVCLWIWLVNFVSPVSKNRTRISRSIDWVANVRAPLVESKTEEPTHTRPKLRLPKFPLDSLARHALLELAKNMTPAVKGIGLLGDMSEIHSLRGAGSRIMGDNMWVDVPIPGGGGLPSTSLRVIQTNFVCSMTSETTAERGEIWLDGRVSASGHVISTHILRSTVSQRINRAAQQLVGQWQFKPLRINAHPTWFHIVLVAWWGTPQEALLHHPLYRSQGATRCRSPLGAEAAIAGLRDRFNGVMPHWVLYPLEGHHPLAVLLAYSRYPDPEVAQAVALFLYHLEGQLRS